MTPWSAWLAALASGDAAAMRAAEQAMARNVGGGDD